MLKTVIDKIVPDYIKIILQKSDEECKIITNTDKVSKIRKCSKYTLNELVQKNKLGQWEEIMILLECNPE